MYNQGEHMATLHKSHTATWIIVIIIVLAAAAAAWLWVWPMYDNNTNQPSATGQNSTAISDNPSDTPDDATATHTYTSVKGVTITLTGIAKDDTITSPLTITGEVPGSWSNEATFPIDISYGGEDLITLASGIATLDGDWKTDNNVPFSATFTFAPPTDVTSGVIVLHNANPSGMPANDDSVAVPVRFQ